jgi:hypothetical protein
MGAHDLLEQRERQGGAKAFERLLQLKGRDALQRYAVASISCHHKRPRDAHARCANNTVGQ